MARPAKIDDLDKMKAEKEALERRIAEAEQKILATYMAGLNGLDLRKIGVRDFKKVIELSIELGGSKALEALTKAAQAATEA